MALTACGRLPKFEENFHQRADSRSCRVAAFRQINVHAGIHRYSVGIDTPGFLATKFSRFYAAK